MSIESVEELFIERSADVSSSGTTASRMFRVITTTSDDGSLTAVNASGVPDVGDDLPDDPDNMWAEKKNASPESDDGCHWKVKVDYVLKPPAQVGIEQWDKEPVINFGYMARSRVMEYCYHGSLDKTEVSSVSGDQNNRKTPLVKVTNSLHQPFDPPVMDEDSILVISIQRNVKHANFNPTYLQTYQNTMNIQEETVAGITIPKFCGWIRDIKAGKQFDQNNAAYWNQTFEILVDSTTWLKQVLDQGFFTGAVDGDGYMQFTPIKDADNDPIRDPIMLDGQGQRNPAANAAVYWYFHSLWEIAWGPLSLPGVY